MFRPEMATAMAAFFLEKAPRQTLNDLVLMKLMVMSEREFMAQTTSLLTGARFASMQNGPVLSEALNLMRGTMPSHLWQSHIRFVPHRKDTDPSNHCILTKPLPVDEFLSEFEIGILGEVWARHGHKRKWEIVNHTHDFPEWDKTQETLKSSSPIALEAIYHLSLNESPEIAKARAEEIAFFEDVSGKC